MIAGTLMVPPVLSGAMACQPFPAQTAERSTVTAASLHVLGAKILNRWDFAKKQVALYGNRYVVIESAAVDQDADGGGVAAKPFEPLTLQDYDRIKTEIRTASEVLPVREASAEISFEGKKSRIRLVLCTPPLVELAGRKVRAGRSLTERDIVLRSNVAVLSFDVARKLFDSLTPAGRTVEISGVDFQVAGMLDERRDLDVALQRRAEHSDDLLDVFIPLTSRVLLDQLLVGKKAVDRERESRKLDRLIVIVGRDVPPQETAAAIRTTLQKHRPNARFVVQTSLDWLKRVTEMDDQTQYDVVMVDFSGVRVTDVMLQSLRDFPQLEAVVVGGAEFDDRRLAFLHGLSSLRMVFLRDAKVTDIGVDALRQAIPQVIVDRR